MAQKFLTSIDLNKNELQNARLQNLGTAPAAPVPGQAYYDTTNNATYVWNGTAWIAADASKVPNGAIPLAKLAADPLARSGHTGTQVAATISDFDTQVRTSRLDQLAAPASAVPMNSQKITGLAAPTAAGDAATKGYVDDAVAGLAWKDAVRAASTANLTLSATQTVDGVALAVGERVLVKAQTTASQNGLWVVASGAWTRATDADIESELLGAAVMVQEGGQAGTQWVLTTDAPITVGTTALAFSQFGGGSVYTAGNGLTLSGNDFNVGAGAGIIVTPDAVTIDTAVVARKYSASFGDGAQTAYTITHNLGTQDVTVSVRQTADNAVVICDVLAATTNTVTITTATAPATNALRATVIA